MVDKTLSLGEALKGYDRQTDTEDIRLGEEERQEILTRFPISAWPNLALEQYALGQAASTDTYSWWLEYGSPHLGILAGGSAQKHLIFRHRDPARGWYFNTNAYTTPEEAWTALREAFVRMFELANIRQWDEIDAIPELQRGHGLRAKSLHVYFPDEMLPISSRDHILHFLQMLQIDTEGMRNWGVVRLNRRLLEAARSHAALQGWTSHEIERFLYHWADPRETRRVVKIAPGDDAKYWEDCRDGDYVCVGWDDVGDLREYESEEDFRDSFDRAYAALYQNHRPTLTKKARELWTLTQLEPGDVIVANKGISHVLAIGQVVEPGYEWRPDRSEYRHVVRVKWDAGYEQEIEPQRRWALVTVAQVPADLYRAMTQKKGAAGPPLPVAPDPEFREIADAIGDALERKGQVILYGPPGTGKTFVARRFAVWWLLRAQGSTDADMVLVDRQAFAAAEHRLITVQMTRRVWWVVANPKEWSWDTLNKQKRVTFRYGRLRRNYPLAQPGDLVVGYQATPDKRIVALARVTKGLKELGDEPGIELEAICRIKDGPSYETLKADPLLSGSEPLQSRCQGTLFALTTEEAEHLLALLTESEPEISKHAEDSGSIGALTWVTFHPSYSYEDFVEGFRPVDAGQGTLVLRLEDGVFKRICREAQAFPKRRYLLLIDEINRANIAKVFGELVTLLEKDKRGLTLALAQSKENFTIPPNVYLLGTMNTADRSIKLLDAALRRRFAFVEMMPNVDLLHGASVNDLPLDDFLTMLNARIAEREGREKQIGHAFLLEDGQPIGEPDEFARRFRQEILPLLQEYCYDDYGALAGYLGDQLVDAKGQTLKEDVLNDSDKLIQALMQVVQVPTH